jgi:hypothetical protein
MIELRGTWYALPESRIMITFLNPIYRSSPVLVTVDPPLFIARTFTLSP